MTFKKFNSNITFKIQKRLKDSTIKTIKTFFKILVNIDKTGRLLIYLQAFGTVDSAGHNLHITSTS